jgi:hypothetical protein
MAIDKSRIDELNNTAILRAIGSLRNLFDPVSETAGTGYPEVDEDIKGALDRLVVAQAKLSTIMRASDAQK